MFVLFNIIVAIVVVEMLDQLQFVLCSCSLNFHMAYVPFVREMANIVVLFPGQVPQLPLQIAETTILPV